MDNERFTSETEEFYENFPDVDLDTVSDSVWQSVKNGERLTDAYRREKNNEAQALARNEKNRMASSGAVGKTVRQRGVYNERDVRAMSPKQVHDEYDNIIKSMSGKGFFK